MANFAINYSGKLLSGPLPTVREERPGEWSVPETGWHISVDEGKDGLIETIRSYLSVLHSVEAAEDVRRVALDRGAVILHEHFTSAHLDYETMTEASKRAYRNIVQSIIDVVGA